MADTCIYCGELFDDSHYGSRRTKEHIVPRSMALDNRAPAGRGNVDYACGRCNGLKGNMLPAAIRAMAEAHRQRAALLTNMADKVDQLIAERRLLP